jgi:magnesium transporter
VSLFNKHYHSPGTAPGTLVASEEADLVPLRLHLIDYNSSTIKIQESPTIKQCTDCLAQDTVTWIHVQGKPSEALLRELGAAFHLHALALEDVLNTGQRPKVETFNDQLFVIMTLPQIDQDTVKMHQVSLFSGSNFLVSFYDGDFAEFDSILKRLRDGNTRIRTQGADYLLYSLIDFVIDNGFPVLESFGLQLEEVEERILAAAGQETLERIHILKRELISLRRMLWPQREVVNQLIRNDSDFVGKETLIYFRDCYDHTIQVMELIETYRDMSSSLLDIHLSSVSNRMNEVMRVLTVIATLFIPLTFVVGVYGMNFDRSAGPWSMPELSSPYGYVAVWLVMIGISLGMLVFFRRRGWF